LNSSPPGPPRPWPLRWHLALLIAGAMLPVVVFSGIAVLRLSGEREEAIERRLKLSARSITWAFEREVAASLRTLQALAQSEHLDRGDLEAFHAEALRVQRTQPSWLTVLLLDLEGQQLVNSAVPRGEPLPRVNEPESLRRMVETRQPTVGGLARGSRNRLWAFPLRVPVLREGEDRVLYVLSAVITPQALAGIVDHVEPEEPEEDKGDKGDTELTRVLVDRRGLIAYRTRNPERFIGTPETPDFLENTQGAEPEGVFRSTTLEGRPSYVAFSRSSLSGWTSAIVVPVEVIEGPFRRSLLAIAASGGLAILVSVAGALVFARRFARSIGSVAAAAEALAGGAQPRVEPSPITEVDRLGQSLERSAGLLRQHEEEERRARMELEAAVRVRDEFLSLASHELKTPLTSLMLQTQLLQQRQRRGEHLPPESVHRVLGQTARQTQRLARLVDDMLDISRLSAGKLALETEQFDLAELASDVVAKLGPQLSEAQCEVSVHAAEPVVGTWDRYRLEQVLTNLLTNAARYAAGKPVEVSVRRNGHGAELRVRDHGRGIAQEDQERIFRKFERAVGSREVSGLGLGLFIVREIVEMHGGTVRVESEPGQGAAFIVGLPMDPAEESPSA
jgi:signal transduction histidine kinase